MRMLVETPKLTNHVRVVKSEKTQVANLIQVCRFFANIFGATKAIA